MMTGRGFPKPSARRRFAPSSASIRRAAPPSEAQASQAEEPGLASPSPATWRAGMAAISSSRIPRKGACASGCICCIELPGPTPGTFPAFAMAIAPEIEAHHLLGRFMPPDLQEDAERGTAFAQLAQGPGLVGIERRPASLDRGDELFEGLKGLFEFATGHNHRAPPFDIKETVGCNESSRIKFVSQGISWSCL